MIVSGQVFVMGRFPGSSVDYLVPTNIPSLDLHFVRYLRCGKRKVFIVDELS